MTKFPNLQGKDISVLIVEDETLLALGMEYSLEEFGYEVSGIETTADAAIRHVYENLPDIILMDINLKGLKTGIEAAKQIWNTHKIPVIFLTSYCDDKTIKEAMLSEPYGYLIKPCRDEELKVAIQTALHKHNYFYKNKNTLEKKKDINLIIKCENGFLYDKTKNLLFKDNEIVKLTGNEIKLFDILTDYPNEPVSFERIYSYIWRDEINDIGRLRTLIYRVKNKLGINLIENIFEIGYKLKLK
ncbi:response regulator [Halarcobacter sp.]|uniref:response regulator n=1 Tax=Halarcobacter sp. TaxID=2321133 RepID=UPI002AABB23E|nr:response regulator [Halarcobacter sp.]